jgi:NAD(P)-dependent dehydrogenase (short-subunit alcohol dehydrogenase family)
MARLSSAAAAIGGGVEQLDGKVAVVTGAASGIGAALARAFAGSGCAVVLADVERGALDAVADELSAQGAKVAAVPTDVSDAASVDALARATVERFGQVDVLCNNAGVSTFNTIADQTLEDWRWVIDVNLWGVVHGVHSFLPIMRRQGTPGHVVNTASIAGLQSGIPFLAPYSASKVAVVSISETLRIELAMEGSPIGVSVLCPSSVDTRVLDAERNRPAALGEEARTGAAEAFRTAVRESFTGDSGKTPAEVADIVLDAIRTNRFWIVTHPGEDAILRRRFDEILSSVPR